MKTGLGFASEKKSANADVIGIGIGSRRLKQATENFRILHIRFLYSDFIGIVIDAVDTIVVIFSFGGSVFLEAVVRESTFRHCIRLAAAASSETVHRKINRPRGSEKAVDNQELPCF